MDLASKKALITSANSFTGKHLCVHLKNAGFDVIETSRSGKNDIKLDITDKKNVLDVLENTKPDFIINLSAISFVAHSNNNDFYNVNTVGATNILDALLELKQQPQKIILSSSAVVYGNQTETILDESLVPNPVNHYGMSKYAMELLAKNYFDKLNIIITRPFNYTGIGQAENFVIPKIVSHYKQKMQAIELGNIDVYREYNDIAYICELYHRLLESQKANEIINLCSGNTISLSEILNIMNEIAQYKIEVKLNPLFVRANEITHLSGSTKKLQSILGDIKTISIQQTLQKLYNN